MQLLGDYKVKLLMILEVTRDYPFLKYVSK